MSGPLQFSGQLGSMVPANGLAPVNTQASQARGELVEYAQVEPSRKSVNLVRRPAPKLVPKNIISLAKARLREVKAELKRMAALEKERGELERLIEAAEGRKQARVVRVLKAANAVRFGRETGVE